MIIRPDGDTLLFITQPDHARLAADLLQHWTEAAGHPRGDALAIAVREHDNGWREDHARLDVKARAVEGVLTIAPPILGTLSVPVRVRVRRLESRRYASAADLRAAFEDAPPELLEGHTAGIAPA